MIDQELSTREKKEARRILLTVWLKTYGEGSPAAIAKDISMSSCLVTETAIGHPMTFDVTRRGRYVALIRFHRHIREWQDAGR
jgi:hypothetical protein